jgi:hypothetical protein
MLVVKLVKRSKASSKASKASSKASKAKAAPTYADLR